MNEAFKMLTRLAGVTTAGLDVEELLGGTVALMHEALGGASVTVYLLDRDGEHLIAQRPDRATVSEGEGVVGRAWQTGALQQVAADGLVAVPLKIGDQVLGVMEIRLPQRRSLDGDLPLIAQAAAGQVAVAIENSRLRGQNVSLVAENQRLFTDGLQLVDELSTLNEVIQSLNTELDLDKLLVVIHQQASRVIDATNFYIALLDQSRQQIMFPFCVDQGQRAQVSPRPLGQGRTGWILQAGEPLFARPDSHHDFTEKELPLSPRVPRCYLGVPLIVGEWVFGVMAVQSDESEDAFAKKDLRLMITIASQAGVAISNARLFEETQAALNKLQEAYEVQERLVATVRELSAPVIQIWEDVLALPLVGAIDAARAQRITESLLGGINRQHAKAVIIDVTGVPVLDSQTAHHLLQAIRAARLLGAHCILTGIGAEVARAMVSAGIQLTGVRTLTNLQAGIQHVMSGEWRESSRPRRLAQTR